MTALLEFPLFLQQKREGIANLLKLSGRIGQDVDRVGKITGMHGVKRIKNVH
jgi:hypothetical protein